MKKRFLAILLCLSVLLMACACAAEIMEPPAVSETESKAPTPQFTLSEVNAESSKTEEPAAPSETAPAESEPQGTISMEESEIELEPVQPVEPVQPIEPIKPEEKETTLEKVLSFDIGEDGLFAYEFLYPNDGPATDPVEIVFPPVRAVDENGNLYVQYFIDWDPYVFCVNTGEKVAIKRKENWGMHVKDGRIFLTSNLMDTKGILEYTLEGLQREYISKAFVYGTKLRFDALGEPYVAIPEVGLQTLDGEILKMETYPKITADDDGVQSLTYGNYQEVLPSDERYHSFSMYGDRMIRASDGKWSIYDLSDNTLYRFTCDIAGNKNNRAECYISDGEGAITSYTRRFFTLGDTVIEAMEFELITSWNGDLYLLAYYPDHGDLYRFELGYTEFPVEGLENAE